MCIYAICGFWIFPHPLQKFPIAPAAAFRYDLRMDLRQTILNELNWKTSAGFTTSELQTILAVGREIRDYVEALLPGGGAAWMQRNLGRTRLHRGGLPQWLVSAVNRQPTSLVFPVRDIWLTPDFDHYIRPHQHLTHEIGHVLDNRSGGWLPAIWFGKGHGDRLTRFLGGRPRGLRWTNGTCGIPTSVCWTAPGASPTECGDLSTADYFAEAFAWAIYDAGRCPHPGTAEWVRERLRGM